MTLEYEEQNDLQLSRSSNAAAISERTLEECWSTLQRLSVLQHDRVRCRTPSTRSRHKLLFMHKSSMQQIHQRNTLSHSGTGCIGAECKPHQCQQCMKSFSSNHQLVQHIRVHTGEKPYKCSYCERRFKQLSHVQQHTRLHTGERPYKCHLSDCGRAFIQLSNLQQHLRNHDAQVERAKNRPFHCNICGKGFANESSLRTHTSKELQLHLGVLQQHAAFIGGPNATSCLKCHKLFLGSGALMEHMKHVHNETYEANNTNTDNSSFKRKSKTVHAPPTGSLDIRQFAALFGENIEFPQFKPEPHTVTAHNAGLDDPPIVDTSNSGLEESRNEDVRMDQRSLDVSTIGQAEHPNENAPHAGLEQRNENSSNTGLTEQRPVDGPHIKTLAELRSPDAPNSAQIEYRNTVAANSERVEQQTVDNLNTRQQVDPQATDSINSEQVQPQNQPPILNTGWLEHRTENNHNNNPWMDQRNIYTNNTAPPDFNHFAALFSGGYFGAHKGNN